MERFKTIFNDEKPLTVVVKLSILYVYGILAVPLVVFANTLGSAFLGNDSEFTKVTDRILEYHWVKSVCTRSFSGPYFPAFGLNMERYSVSLCIQSQCGKIRTSKTPNTDTFYAVYFPNILKILECMCKFNNWSFMAFSKQLFPIIKLETFKQTLPY